MRPFASSFRALLIICPQNMPQIYQRLALLWPVTLLTIDTSISPKYSSIHITGSIHVPVHWDHSLNPVEFILGFNFLWDLRHIFTLYLSICNTPFQFVEIFFYFSGSYSTFSITPYFVSVTNLIRMYLWLHPSNWWIYWRGLSWD